MEREMESEGEKGIKRERRRETVMKSGMVLCVSAGAQSGHDGDVPCGG